MAKCGVCVSAINPSKPKLICNDCKTEFHGSCLKMSKADLECITADGLVWRCNPCAQKRRKSMRFESDSIEGKLTLDDIMKVICEVRDSQKSTEKDFNTSYEALHTKMEETKTILSQQTITLENYVKMVEDVIEENNVLRDKIVDLESRLEEAEQYSRRNTVEINGIPQQQTEDVVSVVKEVGKALDMEITDGMIDACHRLGKRSGSNNQPPAIVVRFVRRLDKEELLRRRRVKSNFSTRHMNLPVDRPVYVNESLTAARRRLFAMAREVKKTKHLKYLWLRNGKIFLRKEDGAPVISVTCQTDLRRI